MKNRSRLLVLLALFVLVAAAAAEEIRTWTLRNGATVVATFIEFQDGRVVLQTADGKRAAAPLSMFSAEDQDLLCGLPAAPAVSIDGLLRDAALWTAPADEKTVLPNHAALGLEWVDPSVRARSEHPCMRFDGRRVWELLATFERGRASQIVASLYNRGDAGSIGADDFKTLLTSAQSALTRWSGSAPSPVKEMKGPANTRVFARAWVRAPHQVILQWSIGAGGLPEFIRLRLTPAASIGASGAAAAAVAMQSSATAPRVPILNSAALRARVRREPNGDCYLPDVPMVDQGQKGYCAAAVTERVLRYYGRDFDQHQVAQMAGSTAEGGTGGDDLVTAVSRIARGLDLNFRKLIEMDVQKYLRLIDDYNRAARKQKLAPFEPGLMIDVGQMYVALDPATLRAVRTARTVDMRQFFSTAQENVGMGVPLLWGVQLGVVAETPELPQASGGHMRLIIGCNPRTQEILYSDSWGSGHALKRMPLADAWTITTGLYTMLPRNVR